MARIYTNASQDRFFYLDDVEGLPAGPLQLRPLSGEPISVDEAAVAPHEISSDEAKELVAEELQAFTSKVAGAMSSVGQVLRAFGEHREPRPEPTGGDPGEVFARALGLTPEELKEDPKRMIGGLRSMLDGLMETVRDAASDAPTDRERTEARIKALCEAVGQSAPESEVVHDAMDRLRRALGNPELAAKVEAAAQKVDSATERLRRRSERMQETLNEPAAAAEGDDA